MKLSHILIWIASIGAVATIFYLLRNNGSNSDADNSAPPGSVSTTDTLNALLANPSYHTPVNQVISTVNAGGWVSL